MKYVENNREFCSMDIQNIDKTSHFCKITSKSSFGKKLYYLPNNTIIENISDFIHMYKIDYENKYFEYFIISSNKL